MNVFGKRVLANMSQCVLLLLRQKLLTCLNRLYLMRHVIKVDCDCRFVTKLNAFDTDLVEFRCLVSLIYLRICLIRAMRILFRYRVDAILLLRFVALRQNNLFQTARTV